MADVMQTIVRRPSKGNTDMISLWGKAMSIKKNCKIVLGRYYAMHEIMWGYPRKN
jgi:hypothetical protein